MRIPCCTSADFGWINSKQSVHLPAQSKWTAKLCPINCSAAARGFLETDTIMIEPDWEQEIPSAKDVQKFWSELEITSLPLQHPALQAVLHHLRVTHGNGGAEFARFQLLYHPVLHWYGSRNRLDEIKFFDQFLTLPSVVAALPALQIKKPLAAPTEIQWGSSFTLDGELAETLVRGGAYEHFKGTAREAKTLTQQFSDMLVEGRYDEVQVYKSFAPWSEWFYDIAWDITWLGLDKRHSQIWLLCVTDTD